MERFEQVRKLCEGNLVKSILLDLANNCLREAQEFEAAHGDTDSEYVADLREASELILFISKRVHI